MTNRTIRIKTNHGDIIDVDQDWKGFIELSLYQDGDATLSCHTRHNSDTSVPFDVWHERTKIWKTSIGAGVVNLEALQAFADRIEPHLEICRSTLTTYWDGCNLRGAYTESKGRDAEEKIADIFYRLQDDEWADTSKEVWEAEDWLFTSQSVAKVADDAAIDYTQPFDRRRVTETLTQWAANEPNVVLVNIDKAVDTLEEHHAEVNDRDQ